MKRRTLKAYCVEYELGHKPRFRFLATVYARSKKSASAKWLRANQDGQWKIVKIARYRWDKKIRDRSSNPPRSPLIRREIRGETTPNSSPDKGRSGGVGVVLSEEAERAIQDADFSGWMDIYGWRDVKDEVPLPLEDVLVAHGDPRTGLLIDIGWISHKGVWCRQWSVTVTRLDAKYWQSLPLLPPIPTQDGDRP